MHSLPLFDTDHSHNDLNLSWISAVGFDIAKKFSGKGWIVLIDPKEIPNKNQCQFYGISPEQFLVVRSSETRSVSQIIQSFRQSNTVAAIYSWTGAANASAAELPVYSISATLH